MNWIFRIGANTRNAKQALDIRMNRTISNMIVTPQQFVNRKTFTCFKLWTFTTKLIVDRVNASAFHQSPYSVVAVGEYMHLNISKTLTNEMKRAHLDDVKMKLNLFLNEQLEICVDESKTLFLFFHFELIVSSRHSLSTYTLSFPFSVLFLSRFELILNLIAMTHALKQFKCAMNKKMWIE